VQRDDHRLLRLADARTIPELLDAELRGVLGAEIRLRDREVDESDVERQRHVDDEVGKTDAEAKLYTGHSFRRTAASLLAESGLSMILLKIAGTWSSDKAAQGYIDTSMGTKRSIAAAFTFDEKEESSSKRQRSEDTPSNVTFNITCGSNCVFNLPGK
jgi:hypothetical protein